MCSRNSLSRARDARARYEESRTQRGEEASQFDAGRALAFYEVVSHMVNQVDGFGIDRESVGLPLDLDVERELLSRYAWAAGRSDVVLQAFGMRGSATRTIPLRFTHSMPAYCCHQTKVKEMSLPRYGLTLADTDGRSNEAHYARVLYDSPAV